MLIIEIAVGVALWLAILAYIDLLLIGTFVILVILLIGIITAAGLFALPAEVWRLLAIAAVGVAGVVFVRGRIRYIRETHARGERVWTRESVIAWSIILGGPTAIVVMALLSH
jgi:hypothetical protein